MNISSKRLVWYTLVMAGILILVAECFYTEENVRGRRAWEKAAGEITARGETLNWTDFIPPAVPTNQNFFQAPMMTDWFVRSTNANATALAGLTGNPETTAEVITELSASNYLSWAASYDPQFDLIREALKRPAARIDGDYRQPFQEPAPNFASYRAVYLVLTHRAKCHLLLHKPDPALADLTLLHHLNLTLVRPGQSRTLIAVYMQSIIAEKYAGAITGGLDAHAWREPDLAALEQQLAEVQLVPALSRSLQKERANTSEMLEIFSTGKMTQNAASYQPNQIFAKLRWRLTPSGWLDRNRALVATLESQLISAIDVTNQTISPGKSQAAAQMIKRATTRINPYNFLAAICTPNFSDALPAIGRTQTTMDQARIVCGLERYRLANGQYPTNLAALLPRFLDAIPRDVISGKPMNYGRKDEQTFLLYSIGWNETDDGGITVRKKDGKEDSEAGDWVWHEDSN